MSNFYVEDLERFLAIVFQSGGQSGSREKIRKSGIALALRTLSDFLWRRA